MLKRISAALLLLTVAIGAHGQAKPAGRQTEGDKLNMAYNKAMQDYYKPYQKAKSQEEMAKIKLDPKKNPVLIYLPKFQALAKKLGRTSDGFQAWIMTMQVAEQGGNTKAEEAAVDAIMANFIDSPVGPPQGKEIAQLIPVFVSRLPYAMMNMPQAQREKKLVAILTRIEAATQSDTVKASAMYARAQLVARDGTGDTASAAKIDREIAAKYPATDVGKRAARDVFEMENLVAGKVAPDFTAVDQDGNTFKLSDYRGKVVVLDFWGFW